MATTNSNSKPRARKSTAAKAAAPAAAAKPEEPVLEVKPEDAEQQPDTTSSVTLNLDTLSKFDVVDDAVEEPFTFRLGGYVFTMCDPRDINWSDVVQGMRNPMMFMRYALPREQQDLFYALDMPAWQVGVLLTAWHKHYNMTDPQDIAKLVTGV